MSASIAQNLLPTYFISHGGGPWPWMKQEQGAIYAELEKSLLRMPQEIPAKPRAVLMISGHWEENDFAVQSGLRPPMIYDYGGFPQHTYSIQYSAPGSPELASRVMKLIAASGLPSHLDAERGYDHGTFVPMAVMYPDADVPLVQLSLNSNYDPEMHFALGQALSPLRSEGVLIVGSGLSYHNLRNFGPGAKAASLAFDTWLYQVLVEMPAPIRREKLLQWENAPAARLAHPQEDHLLPLMVALGAAEAEPAERVYYEEAFVGGVTVSSYKFG